MILRPVDASGDLLPVLSSSDLLSGPEAVARLVQYRLSLLRGEWWENPENGFRQCRTDFNHLYDIPVYRCRTPVRYRTGDSRSRLDL